MFLASKSKRASSSIVSIQRLEPVYMEIELSNAEAVNEDDGDRLSEKRPEKKDASIFEGLAELAHKKRTRRLNGILSACDPSAYDGTRTIPAGLYQHLRRLMRSSSNQ